MAQNSYRRRVIGKFNYVNRWVKYVLCVTNFLFTMLGGTLFVLGIFAFVESGVIKRTSSVSAIHWIFNLTVIVIGVGFITMFVSTTGFIGSLRENRCLLKFYYVSLALFFICEVVIGVLFFVYRENVITHAEDIVKRTFVTQYREASFEDSTNFMDLLQKELQCCGPKSYTDWTANRYFSCNSTNTSPEACGVPFSCCKRMNNINENVINTSCGFDAQKLSAPRAAHQVWTMGCVQALITLLEANIVPVSCAISGMAVLQLTTHSRSQFNNNNRFLRSFLQLVSITRNIISFIPASKIRVPIGSFARSMRSMQSQLGPMQSYLRPLKSHLSLKQRQ